MNPDIRPTHAVSCSQVQITCYYSLRCSYLHCPLAILLPVTCFKQTDVEAIRWPFYFCLIRKHVSDVIYSERLNTFLIVPFLNPNLCIHHSITMQNAFKSFIVQIVVLLLPTVWYRSVRATFPFIGQIVECKHKLDTWQAFACVRVVFAFFIIFFLIWSLNAIYYTSNRLGTHF